MRIQFELSENQVKRVKDLMSEAGVERYKDLFDNALTILEWCIRETRTGRTIASVDEKNEKYKELVMPILNGSRNDTAIGTDG